jgi:LuxR family transcriptional regulator, maltose regulon positive regulatory protein
VRLERVEPSVARAGVQVPLLTSKIVPDRPPTHVVDRTRLDAVLDASEQVVVVSAPAGYGKSTLVANWLAHRPDLRVAWTSLDRLDRNPVAFWRHVIASISRIVPEAVEADEILLERGPSGQEFLAALVHILLTDARPIVVVLDDLHLVDGPAVRDDLALLVDRCQGVVRLVAIGRNDPALPLGRWRAEGRSVEIRDRDLAFRDAEAVELLSHFGLDGLVDADVGRLNERTEGWVVGLLLGALALEGREDTVAAVDDVVRSDRHLVDYLVDEVLERLPEDLRTFALELSVVPFFDADLAQRVTGRQDAATLLHQLVRSNPFVVRSGSGDAHRFHQLIRSILAAELRWRDPERSIELRRRTAEAMLERDRVDVAVEYFLDLGDVDRAFDLVVRPVLDLSDAGRLREFRRWFDLLPRVEPSDAGQAIDYATALVMAGRSDEAVRWVARAAELVAEPTESFRILHAVVSMVALGAGGRFGDAARYFPVLDEAGGDVAGSRGLDARMSGQVVRAALEIGDLERADRWLPAAERHSQPAIARVLAPALRSSLMLTRGDVHGALALAERAAAAADEIGLTTHPAEVDLQVARGEALLARLRLDDAELTIERLAGLTDVLAWPWVLLRTWPFLLEYRALRDGWPAALELASSWSTDGIPERGGDLDVRLDELTARALLGCGRLVDAAAVIERLAPSRRRQLLAGRAAAAAGRDDETERLLADHSRWEIPQQIEALLVLSRVRPGRAALATVADALRLAERGGWLSPFVLEGRSIDRLLEQVPVTQLHPELAEWRRGSSTSSRRTGNVRIVEPLTAKELDVLVHLPSHLTYQGIGAQLYVSVNTVKTYVSSIYRKLGVSSRGEAVEVARSAGLIDG